MFFKNANHTHQSVKMVCNNAKALIKTKTPLNTNKDHQNDFKTRETLCIHYLILMLQRLTKDNKV
jgi:hypothetical protein